MKTILPLLLLCPSLAFAHGPVQVSNPPITGAAISPATVTVTGTSPGCLQAGTTAVYVDCTPGAEAVGIGRADPQARLHVSSGATTSIWIDGNAPIPFRIGASCVTVNSAGSVGIGTTEPNTKLEVNGSTHLIDNLVVGTTGLLVHSIAGADIEAQVELHTEGGTDPGGLTIHRHSDSQVLGAHILGLKSRGTHASPTVIVDDDTALWMGGVGYDGTDYELLSAIKSESDGTPGDDDMPGRLTFLTTLDGANTLSERMRIDNAGLVGIGITNPAAEFHLIGSVTFGDASTNDLPFQVHTSSLVVESGGNVGIRNANPDTNLEINASGTNQGFILSDVNGTNLIQIIQAPTAVDGIINIMDGGLTKVSFTGAPNVDHYFNNGGSVGIGTTSPGGMLEVTATNASSSGTVVNMAASATADAILVKDSAGTIMYGVTPTGCIYREYENHAGITISSGSVVRTDDSTDLKITTAATNSVDPIGLVQNIGGCADGDMCKVGRAGACYALTDDTCDMDTNNWAGVSSFAVNATYIYCRSNPGAVVEHDREVGHVLQAGTPGDLILIEAHFN